MKRSDFLKTLLGISIAPAVTKEVVTSDGGIVGHINKFDVIESEPVISGHSHKDKNIAKFFEYSDAELLYPEWVNRQVYQDKIASGIL